MGGTRKPKGNQAWSHASSTAPVQGTPMRQKAGWRTGYPSIGGIGRKKSAPPQQSLADFNTAIQTCVRCPRWRDHRSHCESARRGVAQVCPELVLCLIRIGGAEQSQEQPRHQSEISGEECEPDTTQNRMLSRQSCPSTGIRGTASFLCNHGALEALTTLLSIHWRWSFDPSTSCCG
ncbi:hypothetical protein EK21DRAFT_91962 [Setomelanomma holmii]|uniref:Uncharacterized protein n=1 Tax=Setomelanomma holmii TaxID=210430 RepID=A0A9P4LJ78_9PLEO|nr:hypothetical protein EK21DRAFT_91962 [Setomelanomma holmii]